MRTGAICFIASLALLAAAAPARAQDERILNEKRRYRDRHTVTANVTPVTVTPLHNAEVTHSNATVTQSNDIAEAEAEAEKKQPCPAKLPAGRSRAIRKQTAVGCWVDIHKALGRPDPALIPHDTTAAQRILAAVKGDIAVFERICKAYLLDGSAWGASKGHALWAMEKDVPMYLAGKSATPKPPAVVLAEETPSRRDAHPSEEEQAVDYAACWLKAGKAVDDPATMPKRFLDLILAAVEEFKRIAAEWIDAGHECPVDEQYLPRHLDAIRTEVRRTTGRDLPREAGAA